MDNSIRKKLRHHRLRLPPIPPQLRDRSTLLLWGMCLLASRTELFGGLHPLGTALFCATFLGGASYGGMLFALVGLLLGGAPLVALGRYGVTMLLFGLAFEKIAFLRRKGRAAAPWVAALASLLSGLFFLFATMTLGGYPLLYDLLLYTLESLLIFGAVSAYSIALPLLKKLRVRRSMTGAETVSMILLFGSAICGLRGVTLFQLISVPDVLCIFIILTFSLRFGTMHGAVAGITMGVIACLSRGRVDESAVSFAFAGMLSGACASFGRLGTAAAFLFGNAIITALANGSTEVFINLYDSLGACLLLLLSPNRLLDAISGYCTHVPRQELAATLAADDAAALMDTFGTLEHAEEALSIRTERETTDEAALLYHRTARVACSTCGMRRYCWEKDKRRTIALFDKMLETCRRNAAVEESALPSQCVRKDTLRQAFLQMYDLFRVDLAWAARLEERELSFSQRVATLKRLVAQFAERIDDSSRFDAALSEDLEERFRHANLTVQEVVALHPEGGGCEVRFSIAEEASCRLKIEAILREATGEAMQRVGLMGDRAMARYVNAPPISLSTAFVCAAKADSAVSGDSVAGCLINRTTYALALCDGMGSGTAASEESRSCCRLLLRLLTMGCRAEDALATVNATLLSARETVCAAIDLCLIDLYNGRVTLHKRGSALSLYRRADSVDIVTDDSLPIGAVSTEEHKVFQFKTGDNGFLVLLSDGVLDAAAQCGLSEEAMSQLLLHYKGNNPQELADQLMHAVHTAAPSDDRSVVAARIAVSERRRTNAS